PDDVTEEERHLEVDVEVLDRAPDSVDGLEPLERRVEHLERRHVVEGDDCTRPALGCAELVEHAVLRDLEEPGRELRAERELREALEDAEENLLRQVLGQRAIAHEPKHVVENRRLIRPENQGEGSFVTPLSLPQDSQIWLLERHGTRQYSRVQAVRARVSPVISTGLSRPRKSSTVGARSRSPPPSRSATPGAVTRSGTGLVVWAVCGLV